MNTRDIAYCILEDAKKIISRREAFGPLVALRGEESMTLIAIDPQILNDPMLRAESFAQIALTANEKKAVSLIFILDVYEHVQTEAQKADEAEYAKLFPHKITNYDREVLFLTKKRSCILVLIEEAHEARRITQYYRYGEHKEVIFEEQSEIPMTNPIIGAFPGSLVLKFDEEEF